MTTQFRDASGQERLLGSIYVPGATVGDVFTVQADGSLAPAPGGGSQPLKVVRFPFAFNTPNLILIGVPFYTPDPGDVWLNYLTYLNVTTPFNGSTPILHFGVASSPSAFDTAVNAADLSLTNTVLTGSTAVIPAVGAFPGSDVLAIDATPWVVMVDDNAGGDPGSTAGSVELVVLIGAA